MSQRLANQEIQLYLDSPLAGILINARSNRLRARVSVLARWDDMRVRSGLFSLHVCHMFSQDVHVRDVLAGRAATWPTAIAEIFLHFRVRLITTAQSFNAGV